MIDHGVDAYGVPYNSPLPPQVIPIEYQGYVFLIFMVISFIVILYMFYIIATDPCLEEE